MFVQIVFEPNTMTSNTLIEVFGHILFSFTGFTRAGSDRALQTTRTRIHGRVFGYSPLESTGREWHRHGDPDEECIYQEYSDREGTTKTLKFIRSRTKKRWKIGKIKIGERCRYFH